LRRLDHRSFGLIAQGGCSAERFQRLLGAGIHVLMHLLDFVPLNVAVAKDRKNPKCINPVFAGR
jgi:hypothetical protein